LSIEEASDENARAVTRAEASVDDRAAYTAIDALLTPRSIAIVGASRRSYVGRVLCENLRSLRFEGDVFPINPRYDEILGWRCYGSLDEVPGAADLVVAAVGFRSVPDLLRAAGRRGVRAAVVPGGGFTETGPEAHRIQADLVSVALGSDLAVCGPNCMGVISPGDRAAAYIGTIPPSLLPGRVALVAQSGSVVEAAVNMGPRIGFSRLISCGNEAVTTVGDYLRWLARDDVTDSVALFIEGFRDPAGFVDGARALRDAGKPLAVLHAGRGAESAAAIAAHSGSLAGSDEVVTGLLHQLGAIGVYDLDELFEVAELLGHGRLPSGRRVMAVTDSGGEANLVRDLAGSVGLELPAPSDAFRARIQRRWPNFAYVGNPIDPWGVDPDYRTLYGEILDAMAGEDVDVLAVALDKVTPWAGDNEVELGVGAAEALVAADRAAGGGKLPVFLTVHATGPAAPAVRDPLRAAGIPLLHGLRPAIVALRRAWYWQQWRPRTRIALPGRATVQLPAEPTILPERESRGLLAAYGVPVVASASATTVDEAAGAAASLGYPVAIKADALGAAHKAASGLVRLGLVSGDAVRVAFDEVTDNASRAGFETRGVLVQAMATGVELICGMRRDPLFGPVVLVGLGGTMTEVVRDVACRVCPPADEDLDEIFDECSVGRLLEATGTPRRPVRDVLAALAGVAEHHPRIAELDVNPLFASPSGVVAADALVVVDHARTT
jgi:acyl-CoA synthetase (NDP forming)